MKGMFSTLAARVNNGAQNAGEALVDFCRRKAHKAFDDFNKSSIVREEIAIRNEVRAIANGTYTQQP